MRHCKWHGNMAELCCSKRKSGKNPLSGGSKEDYWARWKNHSISIFLRDTQLGVFFFLQGKLYCDTVKHEKSLPPAHSCFSMCWTKNLYLFRVTDLNKNSTLGTCASSSQVPELKPLYWKSVKQNEVLKCAIDSAWSQLSIICKIKS